MNKKTKKVERIIQLAAAVHVNDATGNQVFLLDRIFKELSYESIIFSPTIDDPLKEKVKPLDNFRNEYNPDADLLWLHYNLPSVLSDIFRKAVGYKILQFHNFTPPGFFLFTNPELASLLKRAEVDAASVSRSATTVLGDSLFNCRLLESFSVKSPIHLPLIFEPGIYPKTFPNSIRRIYGEDSKNILFVGRIAPNKRLEDLIRCYAYMRSNLRHNCRLIMVGKYDHEDEYFRTLLRMIGIIGVEEVIFTGAVTQEELAAYYKSADLFLSFSEHEGFFMPLLEAYYFGVPVLARRCAAVGETADDAAILFNGTDIAEVAELAEEILTNSKISRELIKRGKKRLEFFDYKKSKSRIKTILENI